MENDIRVLFVVQLPPPIHGSSSISKIFVDSPVINASFTLKVFPLYFAKGMSDIGEFSLLKIFKMFTYCFQLIKVIKSFNPALVYFTLSLKGLSFYRDVLYVAIFKMFNVKIVYHLHVRGVNDEARKNPIKKILYKFVFKSAYPISLSNELAKDISSVCTVNPYVVNNGIMPIGGETGPTVNLESGNSVQLLYLSNLLRAKGIFVLLEALKILKVRNVDFVARIVGKPGDVSLKEVTDFVFRHNLNKHVRIEDAKYGEEKHQAYRQADIFIHPTLNDAFPLVLLEAMQFKLPVISTFEGGIPEIVNDGSTGFLVPKNDPAALADRIEFLLVNEQCRKDMGIAGREKFVSQYTSGVMERNLRDVLIDIHSRIQ